MKPEDREALEARIKAWHDDVVKAGYEMAIPQQVVQHLADLRRVDLDEPQVVG